MRGTSASIAPLTALPRAPDELSTCSSAGESLSIKRTPPSAARIASWRATLLISTTASLIRCTATREDFQLKALGRIRVGNSHLWAPLFDFTFIPSGSRRRRDNPVFLEPAMQIALIICQMRVNLIDAEPIVIQIIQAGVGELGIQTAQCGQIEGVFLTVVGAGEKAHQAFCAGSRMIVDRLLDCLKPRHGPSLDPGETPIQLIHPRTFAGDDVDDGALEFITVADRNIRLHVSHLRKWRQPHNVAHVDLSSFPLITAPAEAPAPAPADNRHR